MYTRENPSPRYIELLEQYKQLHLDGEKILGIPPEKTFNGFSLVSQVERIKRLIEVTETDTILDYGSGKGMQYETPLVDLGAGEKELIIDYWDVLSVDCYDPGYKKYSKLPTDKYGGVVSTDMLEHCPKEDVFWVVEEMFSFCTLFLFANVACYPAKKTLPNGENAHCTIEPATWWIDIFNKASEKTPNARWQLILTEIDEKGIARELEFNSKDI